MSIKTIMGVSSKCGDASLAGVGSFGCPFKFQLPDGIILIRKGYYVPSADVLDKAYLLDLIQTGIAIPLLDSFAFEPINEDDVKETSVTGVNALARKGLTELKFTYKKGIEYEKALEKLQSFGAFDVWVVDKSGNFLGIEKMSGFGGFTAGLVLPKTRIWNNGSESEGKELEVQLTQPGEVIKLTWIEASALDFFAPTEIDGINSTKITFADASGDVPPVAGSEYQIRVLASDGATPILGLGTGDIVSTLDGVPVASVTAEDGDGYYTVTATIVAGELVTKLNDSVAESDAVNIADILFGGSASATVV
jgi:hypothetical protein